MRDINIRIKRKDFWLFSVIIVFLIGIGFVVAYTLDGSGTPSIHGHSIDELEGVGSGGGAAGFVYYCNKAGTGVNECTDSGGTRGYCPEGFIEKYALGDWGDYSNSFFGPCGQGCKGWSSTRFIPPGGNPDPDNVHGQAYFCVVASGAGSGSGGACYTSYVDDPTDAACLAGFKNEGSLGEWGFDAWSDNNRAVRGFMPPGSDLTPSGYHAKGTAYLCCR